ncbi:hypothetical protein FJZ41_04055, partial [Candidatus Shapirobacteria bacterium]|nr:hypothetical protein [Candidatus Shapirobacteria bacterium]
MKIHQRLFWFLILLLPVQLGRHFWPASSYLLGIRIDYLAPTVYLTDLLLLAILILWGAEKIRARKKITFPYLKYGWVLAFLILLFLNAFLAQNQTAAFYKLIKIIEFSLLGFYLAQNKFSLNFYQKPLLAAVIYSSLLALAQFLSQSSLGGPFWWLGERTFDLSTPGIAKAVFSGQLLLRPYATFSHPNALAGFILVALIILVPTGWLRLRAVKR